MANECVQVALARLSQWAQQCPERTDPPAVYQVYVAHLRADLGAFFVRLLAGAPASCAEPAHLAAVAHRALFLLDATAQRHMDARGNVAGHAIGAWAVACFWVAQKFEYGGFDFTAPALEALCGVSDLLAAERALLRLMHWDVAVPTAVDLCGLMLEQRAATEAEACDAMLDALSLLRLNMTELDAVALARLLAAPRTATPKRAAPPERQLRQQQQRRRRRQRVM